jgi:hypothetical protein
MRGGIDGDRAADEGGLFGVEEGGRERGVGHDVDIVDSMAAR